MASYRIVPPSVPRGYYKIQKQDANGRWGTVGKSSSSEKARASIRHREEAEAAKE